MLTVEAERHARVLLGLESARTCKRCAMPLPSDAHGFTQYHLPCRKAGKHERQQERRKDAQIEQRQGRICLDCKEPLGVVKNLHTIRCPRCQKAYRIEADRPKGREAMARLRARKQYEETARARRVMLTEKVQDVVARYVTIGMAAKALGLDVSVVRAAIRESYRTGSP